VDVTVAGDADTAALARILGQAGLAAQGRLKYRNALIHCDEVRQNLSAIQNREFCARSTVSQGAIVGRAYSVIGS
jgi:hypothetical protein